MKKTITSANAGKGGTGKMTILTRNTILLVLAISMLLAVLVGCKGPGSSTSSSESTDPLAR